MLWQETGRGGCSWLARWKGQTHEFAHDRLVTGRYAMYTRVSALASHFL